MLGKGLKHTERVRVLSVKLKKAIAKVSLSRR